MLIILHLRENTFFLFLSSLCDFKKRVCDILFDIRLPIWYDILDPRERRIGMKVSYKSLWKLLIDMEWTQADLHKQSGISSGSMTKLRKGEPVSMEVLYKVCTALDCNIGDIVEFAKEVEK